nr:cuticle protein AMP4-like isoform X1 [Procambarus clarkii]
MLLSGVLQVVLACLVAAAAAAPQFSQNFNVQEVRRPVAILRDERQDNGDGSFTYEFEAENGIVVNAEGSRGSQGQSNIQGVFRYPLLDGTVAEVRYIADENGYQPQSDLIPTPHPLPAHALEQIRVAEEQRRQGITFQ